MGYYISLLIVCVLLGFLLFCWYVWYLHKDMETMAPLPTKDDRPFPPPLKPAANKSWYDGNVYSFPKPAKVTKVKQPPVVEAPTSRSN